MNVVLSRATRKLTIKGDPDYFKQVGKARGTADIIKISTGKPPDLKKFSRFSLQKAKDHVMILIGSPQKDQILMVKLNMTLQIQVQK